MIEHAADVLVVGGGISGAFAAIEARRSGASAILVDKAYFGRSGCSALASGVQQVFVPDEDDIDGWLRSWGGSLVNMRLARKAIVESHDVYRMMDAWGVKWIKHGDRLVRVSSGGAGSQSVKQAMFAEGGPQMMMAMRAAALSHGVDVLDRVMIVDLVPARQGRHGETRVAGAVGFHCRDGSLHAFHAKAVIMCTGPYRFPNNSRPGLGFRGMPLDAGPNGIAMMLRAGAVLGKLEFGGYAPTPYDSHSAPGLELIGGLGGRFVDAEGRDILSSSTIVGDAGFQARRSSISLAIARRLERGEGPVYLDFRHFKPDEYRLLRNVIPIVIGNMERAGYDPTRQIVPYLSTLPCTAGGAGGGAAISETGATSVPGLFAAGNCTDGAYLSMGQQLVGCAVLGRWAGMGAGAYVREAGSAAADWRPEEERLSRLLAGLDADVRDYSQMHPAVESILTDVVGYELTDARLSAALERLAEVGPKVAACRAADLHELGKVISLQSFCQVFDVVLRVMIRRKESRGNVIKADAPYTDNIGWLSYTRVRRGRDGDLDIWEDPRPTTEDYLPVAPTRDVHPYFAEVSS